MLNVELYLALSLMFFRSDLRLSTSLHIKFGLYVVYTIALILFFWLASTCKKELVGRKQFIVLF